MLINNKFQQLLPTATLLLFSIGLVWQSTVRADDLLYNASVNASGVLAFSGTEKLKLSKCCKPAKTAFEIKMSIPASEKWQIDNFRGQAVTIEGTYTPKNDVWNTLAFLNQTEKDEFIALIKAWAGETVELDTRNSQLRVKVEEEEGIHMLFLYFRLSLKRVEDNTSGVYMFNVRAEVEPSSEPPSEPDVCPINTFCL